MIDKLEIPQRDKGKASLVDNLLQKMVSLFTDQVAIFQLPIKFKVRYIAT